MEPLRSLYDTNILIDFLRHIPLARVELSRHPTNHISVVTCIEVMAGAPIRRAEDTRAFLTTFTVLPLTPDIAERAAILRQQTRLKLPDAVILATAQHEYRTLVTRNTRDFSTAAFDLYIPYTL